MIPRTPMLHLKWRLCVKTAQAWLQLEVNTTSGRGLKWGAWVDPPKSTTLEEGRRGSVSGVQLSPKQGESGSRIFSVCRGELTGLSWCRIKGTFRSLGSTSPTSTASEPLLRP